MHRRRAIKSSQHISEWYCFVRKEHALTNNIRINLEIRISDNFLSMQPKMNGERCTVVGTAVCFQNPKCSPVFIARQHIDERYWCSNSVRPFVCPSVRHVPLLYPNDLKYFHILHHTIAQSFQFYAHQTPSRNSDGAPPPCGGAKYRWGMKILQFSTNKWVYLANDTR